MQQQLVELFVFPSHVRNDGLKIISRIALLGYVSLKGWCHSQICPIKFHALGSMSSCAVPLYDLFVSALLQSLDALVDGYRCLFGQKGKFGSSDPHVFSQLLGKRGTVVWLNETCYRIVWLCSRIFWKNANTCSDRGFHGLPSQGFNSAPEEYQLLLQAGWGESANVYGMFFGMWNWSWKKIWRNGHWSILISWMFRNSKHTITISII